MSRVSNTRSLAVFGADAKGVAMHWPVVSNLVAVEGTDESPFTDAPTGRWTKIGAEMGIGGFGDTDAAVWVAPDNNVLTHPRLLN